VKAASNDEPVRLKMPPRLKMKREPTVALNIRISIPLNNKIVESAIAKNATLQEEVCSRLEKSFESES
jgi:hypothetical protein